MNIEELNNSTVNFTSPETSNSTIQSVGLVDFLKLCVFGFNLLSGLPMHSYVIWLIVTGTGSGVTSEFFCLNLSVCEIGNSLICVFYILSICFPNITVLPLILSGLIFTGRPLFQCLICVERYLAVVHPVTFLKYKPLRYRVICCAAAWSITLASCFLCLYMRHIQIHFLCVHFLLAISMQLFCLVAVLRALKQSGPGERGREREEENHMKRRAFLIILINTVTMTIIYVPFAIAGLVTILTNQNIYSIWITGLICYILAGFVHPVLYLHRARKLPCL
ncbi:G-protein coupled receptor 35-like [Puntigrus tetrazona]|uniref:G-protein coupled receptor 35-like n=1 Tax=Puntigrus tetrazona TaxID=1606681 RepID=UPI001C8A4C5B|nr:G-protein coupled receptor 35-like [Puntigrus tetrazona]XP_043072442.1 G-protein coupled receptor 35-like [Puntigrus tetrazona]XP_043087755.1 G-protein coupled receptor 35-like [Puntigrus tetrazona]XP_043114495.1 G-protein coupled receptor 35-like [Puntigrus tetrazona]XP_043114496.1 G-protein coupled receptor 35-like [Puntigrus tetrazona]